jgi:hypothetical protein
MVIAMEPLVEIILFIACGIMAFSLLPLRIEVQSALRLAGLMVAAPGVALFAVIAYPRATLWCLGAGSMVAGVGWGYAWITQWLTDRGLHRWTAAIGRFQQASGNPGGHAAAPSAPLLEPVPAREPPETFFSLVSSTGPQTHLMRSGQCEPRRSASSDGDLVSPLLGSSERSPQHQEGKRRSGQATEVGR